MKSCYKQLKGVESTSLCYNAATHLARRICSGFRSNCYYPDIDPEFSESNCSINDYNSIAKYSEKYGVLSAEVVESIGGKWRNVELYRITIQIVVNHPSKKWRKMVRYFTIEGEYKK